MPLVLDADEVEALEAALFGSKAAAPASSTCPGRRNSGNAKSTRRHELFYLRCKVQQLENQLSDLQQRQIPRDAARASTSNDATASIWGNLATQQLERREEAERENARLKMALQSQIRLAKSLEAEGMRRSKHQLVGMGHLIQEIVPCSPLDLVLDQDTYDELLARAKEAHTEVDSVLSKNNVHREVPFTHAQMRNDRGVYADIFATKMLPFDYVAVVDVIWSHYRGNGKHPGNLYENFTKDLDDTVAEMFVIAMMARGLTVNFRVKQVVRRYVEADRQVVVWVSTASAEEEDPAFAGFGYREEGFTACKRAPGREGFSMLETSSFMWPLMTEGGLLSRLGPLSEYILSLLVNCITSSQKLIENELIDKSIAVSKTSD